MISITWSAPKINIKWIFSIKSTVTFAPMFMQNSFTIFYLKSILNKWKHQVDPWYHVTKKIHHIHLSFCLYVKQLWSCFHSLKLSKHSTFIQQSRNFHKVTIVPRAINTRPKINFLAYWSGFTLSFVVNLSRCDDLVEDGSEWLILANDTRRDERRHD